jgi:hypothetical protein
MIQNYRLPSAPENRCDEVDIFWVENPNYCEVQV